MKGVIAYRSGRLRRVAVLACVAALAAAASVAGGAQAHAAGRAVPVSDLGNGQGTLVVSPASGSTLGALTVTSAACPSNAQDTAELLLVDPLRPKQSQAALGGIVAAPASAFTVHVAARTFGLNVVQGLDNNLSGDTAEIVVECFPGSVLANNGVFANDAFLSFSSDGSKYTQVPNPRTASSTPGTASSTPGSASVTLTASPNPATSGQSVTLTATVTP